MPLVSSSYQPPYYLKNGHLATIVPSLFRTVEGVRYDRERLEIPDGDFLDLDWSKRGSDQLIVISHGLEGSASRDYIKGMVKYFNDRGWDALAWNCRSCSGEMNRLARFYHHGDTDDLAAVVDHVKHHYKKTALVGFSMGGSLTLKYIGERGSSIDKNIIAGAAFSVPVSLKSSVDQLAKWGNAFYRKRFLKKLKEKVQQKSVLFPDEVKLNDFKKINYFPDFDNLYTAPLHGFEDAQDFYHKASAGEYMYGARIPVLLCNALNDPFLGKACYPVVACQAHPFIHLEIPSHGGHVGFSLMGKEYNYMEQRALEFCSKY